MNFEEETLEKLSSLRKVQMSTQRQQEIRNMLGMKMDKGMPRSLKHRTGLWRSGAAAIAAVAVVAIVVGGIEHFTFSSANNVTGAGVKTKTETSSRNVSVPKLGGKSLTEIFKTTIQNNGSKDNVSKAIYFETKTDGRNVPGVKEYFDQEGGVSLTMAYSESFVVIARGKFNATSANGRTGTLPANTSIIAYDVKGGVEQAYFLNMSKSKFKNMETTLMHTSPAHELPYTTAAKSALSLTPEKAIAEVNPVLGTTFPSSPSTVHRKIEVGGPYPNRTIPATLQTQVDKVGTDTYVVSFTEKWNSIDFIVNDAQHGAISKHTWKYKVSPNHSTLLSQRGNFPPQEVK